MTVQTAEYLDAIAHLPPGSKLTFYEISWQQYEQLLSQLGDAASPRVSYDSGRLDVMSPSSKHEKLKNVLHDLVLILSDELDLDVLSLGSVTLKVEPKGKGFEADDCFYVQRAGEIGEKDQLDLLSDPPPDLVLEIDVAHDSSGKFPIYVALGVPEIWRYEGSEFSLWQLSGQAYVAVSRSLAFPILTVEDLAGFLSRSQTEGRKQTRQHFRAWVRSVR
ncbi:MAG: Uma2 family endonuclease [Acidobacteria bacterium]|nr:Uma2 family endonuclease [Acidobacteriota bacterium]